MSGKLAQILEDQYTEAKAKPGLKIIRKLQKGLRIEMLLPTTAELRLSITRDDKFPSIQEWETVTRYLPFEVPKLEPAAKMDGPRFVITARFTTPRVMQMKF